MFVRNKNIAFIFDLYNDKLTEAYNEMLFSEYPAQGAYNDDEIKKSVEKIMIKWALSYKSKQFDGLSFYAYFESLDDENIAFDYILHSAYICDDGVPPILISLLNNNRVKIVKHTVDFILKIDWQNNMDADEAAGDDILAVSSLVYLLEYWNCEYVYEYIVSKYVLTDSPFDIISDSVKSYLSSLETNECMVQYLIKNIYNILDKNQELSVNGEILLISLIAISAGSEDTNTYECLKDCFLRTKNKIISAICFADLKDRRAVEFLRNWMIKNQKKQIDIILKDEIISSIKRLDGEISDIEDIFT